MSEEELPERPKIYFTARGERYVKAGELLRSKRGRAVVKKMAGFAKKQQTQQSPKASPK